MRAKSVVYWIVTILFCGFLAWSAYGYLSRAPKMVAAMASLGYPDYVLNILGVAKLIGVLVLLVPGCPKLKEWAYAGFTIDLIGATWSHLASGQQKEAMAPVIFLVLLAISYGLRPVTRRFLAVDVVTVSV
jgi:DoxX-like family